MDPLQISLKLPFLPMLKAYLLASMMTLLTYDYLCTLDQEINLVWSRPFSIGSVLFFVNRYTPFIDMIMSLYMMSITTTPKTCERVYSIITWFTTTGLIVSESILILRTIALWKRRRSIIILMSVLALLTIVPGLIITHLEMKSLEFIPLIPILRIHGCNLRKASSIIVVSFLLVLVLETIIVVLTIIKAYQHLRRSNSSWVMQLYRDGILFYIYMLVVTLLNVIVPIKAIPNFKTLFSNPQRVLHSILCSRVIFGILSQRGKRPQSDSHRMSTRGEGTTTDSEGGVVLTSVFAASEWEGENEMVISDDTQRYDKRDWTE
ncbi:hypothetical protein BDQ12DRAFT_265848 [Crucibulum laeve]|uniref:DUF6533 domain-containing protein n=1 Tax=Crucibulum laeve TaxID=68775 RepID=A0A5C3LSE4_9AGAR|nr:hypothetical protein BDQ12DRAFT_265848 [Crucibulum laeve]